MVRKKSTFVAVPMFLVVFGQRRGLTFTESKHNGTNRFKGTLFSTELKIQLIEQKSMKV